MIHRCILIFPRFCNIDRIEEIRGKYDPLFTHVQPHITLVFPFRSDLSKQQIHDHIVQVLKRSKPFKLKLEGISGEEGGYLFLNVVEGRDELIELHNRLYEGILGAYYPPFLENNKYSPHMTVGRIANIEELNRVADNYRTMNETFEEIVREISVEITDENEDSIIEMIVKIEDFTSNLGGAEILP